jgi:hypothetical protein
MMRYLFIVLFICSTSPVYAGSKPSWSYEQRLLESDRLFLDWYVGYFFYSAQNPALKQLGSDLSKDPTVTHGAGSDIALRKHIASLPVKQQARLFLLTSLCIPLDGEKAEYHWGYFFQDHQPEIKRLLLPIRKSDLADTCRWMGIEQEKALWFYERLKKWKK